MELVAAKKVALQAMMDCLGYTGHEGTAMYSARLAAAGPAVIFLGSISGDTLNQFLDAAQAYLERRGLSGRQVSVCKDRAIELMGILSAVWRNPIPASRPPVAPPPAHP